MAGIATLTDVTSVERSYLRLVRTHGLTAPPAKRVELVDPISDDGISDCWTHAWNLAQRTGGAYVEGVCVRPGAGGVSMHAWVEETTVFGAQIVETTAGYEHATGYRGLRVDCRTGSAADTLLVWDGPRGSTIQGLLDSGLSPAEVLVLLRPH